MTDVAFSIGAAKGVLTTTDLTMHAFGGKGSAAVRGDFSGKVPAYRVHGVLTKFRLEEFSKNFSQKKIGEGLMDFSTELTMSGANVDEMTRTSSGEASLRGTNLTLDVGNLDDELSHYRATQRFTLVDLGAFFLAGPIGLAVTKGIDYSKVLSAEGGTSQVQIFISEWHVERGIAEAKDVAMSTKEFPGRDRGRCRQAGLRRGAAESPRIIQSTGCGKTQRRGLAGRPGAAPAEEGLACNGFALRGFLLRLAAATAMSSASMRVGFEVMVD